MIRIIFDNGAATTCDNIKKIYIEEFEMDKVTIVGNLKEVINVRTGNTGNGKSNTDIEAKTTVN